ncbi:ROK family protein [bacterium]|nr:ROK family protein [bacterium]
MATLDIDTTVVRHLQLSRQASRVDLARRLSVSPSTMGLHVDRLLDRGYLCETPSAVTLAGRPPKVLGLNPDAGEFLGLDLDAREIYGVSLDFAQRPLKECTVPIAARDDARQILFRMEQVLNHLHDRQRPLLGIGIAAPGAVDIQQGLGLHYQFIRGWKQLPLVAHFQEQFEMPVCLENNVRAMALAERWFGQANEIDHALCLGIRSGIGSGVLMHGELYSGSTGLAGEIGGWPIRRRSATTLEDFASLRAILNRLTTAVRRGKPTSLTMTRNRVTSAALFQAITERDALTWKVLREAAREVGRAVAQMILLLNPQRVILCGALAPVEAAFVEPLRQAVRDHLPLIHAQLPDIVASTLGDRVGALGAAALAARHWQPMTNLRS